VHPELVPSVRALLGDRPVLGDSRYRLHDLAGLDGATPNLEETEALLGAPLDDADADGLGTAGRMLRQRLGYRVLLVTRGSAGMSLFVDGARHGYSEWHLPVHGTDQVADVTGAGDTVIGAFALALAAGASPIEAACLANYAGGIVVMKMGTATVSPDELRDAVHHDADLLDRITGR
jgi:bifunctional ADP-heptose synthase (sugar kinase/adenylyltransferase)